MVEDDISWNTPYMMTMMNPQAYQKRKHYLTALVEKLLQ